MLPKKNLTILSPELHKSFCNFIVIKCLGNHAAECGISYLIDCISYSIQSTQYSQNTLNSGLQPKMRNSYKNYTEHESELTLWQTKKSRICMINRCFSDRDYNKYL